MFPELPQNAAGLASVATFRPVILAGFAFMMGGAVVFVKLFRAIRAFELVAFAGRSEDDHEWQQRQDAFHRAAS